MKIKPDEITSILKSRIEGLDERGADLSEVGTVLSIGDGQTGKSTIGVDTIINNRDKDLVCIYVAVGQRMSTVVQVAETLRENNAMDNTIIVAAPADEAAPIKFMAPYAGCAMGEHFL